MQYIIDLIKTHMYTYITHVHVCMYVCMYVCMIYSLIWF